MECEKSSPKGIILVFSCHVNAVEKSLLISLITGAISKLCQDILQPEQAGKATKTLVNSLKETKLDTVLCVCVYACTSTEVRVLFICFSFLFPLSFSLFFILHLTSYDQFLRIPFFHSLSPFLQHEVASLSDCLNLPLRLSSIILRISLSPMKSHPPAKSNVAWLLTPLVIS